MAMQMPMHPRRFGLGKRSKTIFADTVQSLSYCCPHNFLKLNSDISTGVLASLLGFERRTVRYWRAAFKASSLQPCSVCREDRDNSAPRPVADGDIFSRLPTRIQK